MSNANVTLAGSALNVQAATGAIVTIGGNGQYSSDSVINTITAKDARVEISPDSRVNVFMSDGDVISNGNTNFGVYGAQNTIIQTKSDSLWVGSDGGHFNRIYAPTEGGVVTLANDASVTIWAGHDLTLYAQGHAVASWSTPQRQKYT